MCSPCVCYKYEDCGPSLQCLPRSAFKRNGLQDCQFFQQGSIRYLCRSGPCCSSPCPPCCPPCVRRPPPGKTYKGKASKNDASGMEEDSARKKDEMENVLKRTKSRELRGGIMYYSCHCIKRNGLQHDCRRTGCGGQPACLVLPDPLCPPSQLARARGLADPAPLAPHYAAASDGEGTSGGSGKGHGLVAAGPKGLAGGKQYIVCELMKGVLKDDGQIKNLEKCKCKSKPVGQDPSPTDYGDQGNRGHKPASKETCTRPDCVHWKPPPPCVWDLPCKADCFEAPPGIKPGRNQLRSGGGGWIIKE